MTRLMRFLVHGVTVAAAAAIALTAFCRSAPRSGCAPAIDPAGSRLAYLEYQRARSGFRLVVEDLATSQRRVLDDDLPSIQPAWSPDGKLVAYAKVDASLSAAVSIVNVDSGARRTMSLRANGLTIALAWMSADRLVVGAGDTLEVLDIATGTVVSSRDLGEFHLQPDFASLSINAAGIAAFAVDSGSVDRRAVWTLALPGDAVPHPVTEGHDDVSPVWLDDHRILFSRAAAPVAVGQLEVSERHLWLIDVATKEARQVTTGHVIDGQPAIGSRSVFFTRIDIPARRAKGDREELPDFFSLAQITSLERKDLR